MLFYVIKKLSLNVYIELVKFNVVIIVFKVITNGFKIMLRGLFYVQSFIRSSTCLRCMLLTSKSNVFILITTFRRKKKCMSRTVLPIFGYVI